MAVYYVAEDGTASAVENAAYENGTVTFTTDHFSSYVVAAKPAAPADPPLPPSPPAPPAGDSEPTRPSAPAFTDVAEDYWAKVAIEFAAENGYIQGNTDGSFAPADPISRQQIWMILSRLAGADAENMAAAKVWAMENGISDGSNPGASVTRQQLVTLLYRYALSKGYDVSVGEDTNILSYDDVFDAAEYAIPAFQWACGAGVINGTTESTLSPLGTATRAQFAVMLRRFTENVAK
ncbi:MAG: S-layer homology domain-containing protein [Oscillospiraceae bacterium]|nr:S-layer homology domain-containing protein [Oscillospiraceae bacterium]